MKLQLQQDRLPKNLLCPSLLRPLHKALRAAANICEVDAGAETSILLTDDTRITILNRDYRGFDKATDVLSFPQDDPIMLGDIVISLDTAGRQSAAAQWPLSSELALLAVHGFLHLLGHDDEELEGAQEMEVLTRKVLTAASIVLPGDTHPFFRSFLED
jgi:probable rRNA maturation factor